MLEMPLLNMEMEDLQSQQFCYVQKSSLPVNQTQIIHRAAWMEERR